MRSATTYVRREEGQIIPIILLVIVALVIFGLAIAQLGSAGDQKTQTQSAADAGALAGAKSLAADLILADHPALPGTSRIYAAPATAAYEAAEQAWSVNHHKTQLDPGDVVIERVTSGSVKVTVTAPPGEIIDGPVRGTADVRPIATASAALRLNCQAPGGALNAALNQLYHQLGLGALCQPPPTTTTTTTAPSPPPAPPPPLPVPPLPAVDSVQVADLMPYVRVVLVR